MQELFGKEEAENALLFIAENQKKVRNEVETLIAAHRKVFEGKSEKDRTASAEEAEMNANESMGGRS